MTSAPNNMYSNPEKYSVYFLREIEGNLQMSQLLLYIGLCLGKQMKRTQLERKYYLSYLFGNSEDNKWLYFNFLSAASTYPYL
jgi:hypothetical protein